jgi:hypothetical protein
MVLSLCENGRHNWRGRSPGGYALSPRALETDRRGNELYSSGSLLEAETDCDLDRSVQTLERCWVQPRAVEPFCCG